MIRELFTKYREIIAYLFFGVCTTAINTACYALFTRLGLSNVVSVLLAWLFAVLFAFFTNRRYVFDAAGGGKESLLDQMKKFFGARIATGLLDLAIMYVAVDILHQNGDLWKLISNVIVIILNYLLSKLVVFRKS